MAATRNTGATRQSRKGSFGLLANGSSGPWEITIDETTAGPDRWYAQIEGPSVTFCFEIPSLDVVGKMIQFLESRQPPARKRSDDSTDWNGSLLIGKDKRTPVTLVKDDEYEDRFFLAVGP